MSLIYNFGIHCYTFLLHLVGLFNSKAKKRARAERQVFLKVSQYKFKENPVWLHAASLGEFEQGRPLIEKIKRELPEREILLTFFSPSGYEVRKDYDQVDLVTYIPLDRKKAVKKFLALTKPKLAIFIKYEFWSNFIVELQHSKIPILSVSSIFREDQVFFKPYGGFFKKALEKISQFYVQDEKSEQLLHSIGIKNVIISGDTRFDRVIDIASNRKEIGQIKQFKQSKKILVVGSSWKEDLEVIIPFINSNKNELKFIIAPHEISEENINWIENKIQKEACRYSAYNEKAEVLIIDNIGMLSSIYSYADFAFIGGAFGAGLHNILEAAVYQIPVMFGNKNYKKFAEANSALELGGAFSVSNESEFNRLMNQLLTDTNFYQESCEANKKLIDRNKGASDLVMEAILNHLNA